MTSARDGCIAENNIHETDDLLPARTQRSAKLFSLLMWISSLTHSLTRRCSAVTRTPKTSYKNLFFGIQTQSGSVRVTRRQASTRKDKKPGGRVFPPLPPLRGEHPTRRGTPLVDIAVGFCTTRLTHRKVPSSICHM